MSTSETGCSLGLTLEFSIMKMTGFHCLVLLEKGPKRDSAQAHALTNHK